MSDNRDYQLGLLYLIHLLVSADGMIDEKERQAIKVLQQKEHVSDKVYRDFAKSVANKKEREIYQAGIDHVNRCTDQEKLNAFVHLYKMSEADGNVHVKEVRLLLYSIKMARIEFQDVVALAKKGAT